MAWKHKLVTTRLTADWKALVQLAERLVNRYSSRSMALPEDLFQAAMTAIPAILASWDGNRSLVNWAWQPMRKAIFVEMRGAAVVKLPEERVLEISRREKDSKALGRAVSSLSRKGGATDACLAEIETLRQRLDRADRNALKPTDLEGIQAITEDTVLDFEKYARRKHLHSALRGVANSSQEQEILRKVLCQGNSAHQAARDLGISHTTVNKIVRSLLERLHERLVGKVEIDSLAWEYGDCA